MTTLDRILEMKKQLELRDAAFERLINVPGRTVDAWKRGLSHSYLKNLAAIAGVLGVTTDYLLGVENEEMPVDFHLLARKAGMVAEKDRSRVLKLLNATIDTFLEQSALDGE